MFLVNNMINNTSVQNYYKLKEDYSILYKLPKKEKENLL